MFSSSEKTTSTFANVNHAPFQEPTRIEKSSVQYRLYI